MLPWLTLPDWPALALWLQPDDSLPDTPALWPWLQLEPLVCDVD